jgi:hypothetical protein
VEATTGSASAFCCHLHCCYCSAAPSTTSSVCCQLSPPTNDKDKK